MAGELIAKQANSTPALFRNLLKVNCLVIVQFGINY